LPTGIDEKLQEKAHDAYYEEEAFKEKAAAARRAKKEKGKRDKSDKGGLK
jgi:hypothetical protein